MGLKKDLVIAKIRAAQESDSEFVLTKKQMGIFEKQSEYEARAILNFLCNPELKFTLEELKASVEIEEIQTSDTLDAHIKMTRTINQKVGQISSAKSLVDIVVGWVRKIADVEIPAVGTIGSLTGISALLGIYDTSVSQIEQVAVNTIPADEGRNEVEIPKLDLKKTGGSKGMGSSLRAVPGSDTQVEVSENDFTSVVLFEDRIPTELTDGVETGEEDYNVRMEG